MIKFDIDYFENVTSTNTVLKEIAANNGCEGKVIVAESQSAGKGSKGRSFFSANCGLYFSVLLRPECKVEEYLYITPFIAVAVAQAIEKIANADIKIKWVNDLYINNRKICGILCERGTDRSGNSFVVAGIGINLNPPAGGFPEEIKDIAGTVFDAPISLDKKQALLNQILNNIANGYTTLTQKRFLEVYRAKSILLNKQVSVTTGTDAYEATAIDINDNFELVIRTKEGKIVTLNSADVALKITCKI